ncbi:hypothetical protein VKT23_009547 [Stygiomarasmius scandens]|uniref:Uncharacterized protein n=1 Tax=Marasmiellus scandens TaxID=2682957 RepID=A0ABR1JGM6_9AGAR
MGIKVSVVKNGKKLPSFTCTINKDMRMTTFLWHIATNCDQDREQVMRNPVFKNSKNAIIDMDLEVKHPSVGTEVTLEI